MTMCYRFSACWKASLLAHLRSTRTSSKATDRTIISHAEIELLLTDKAQATRLEGVVLLSIVVDAAFLDPPIT